MQSSIKVQWERELERRRKFGITDFPDPLPHPDHVKVDFRTGSVQFAGPMTKEEEVEYDDLSRTKEVLRDGINELTARLETEDDQQECKYIERHIRLGRESPITFSERYRIENQQGRLGGNS